MTTYEKKIVPGDFVLFTSINGLSDEKILNYTYFSIGNNTYIRQYNNDITVHKFHEDYLINLVEMWNARLPQEDTYAYAMILKC